MSGQTKTLILGAGSAGCHLTQAFYHQGCDITVRDIDHAALTRLRTKIYPSRYGAWPKEIVLEESEQGATGDFDIVAIATPPATHAALIRQARFVQPKGLLIEKPICLAHETEEMRAALKDMESRGTIPWVNYNHSFSPAVPAFLEQLDIMRSDKRPARYILTEWREHINYINQAHWWQTFSRSYLCDSDKGGGSMYEHSHGMALTNLFFEWCDMHPGGVIRSTGMTTNNNKFNYDEVAVITIGGKESDKGIATCITDFISDPPRKRSTIMGAEWSISIDFSSPAADTVEWHGPNREEGRSLFPKTRALEFNRSVEFFMQKMRKKDEIKWDTVPWAINTVDLIAGVLERNKKNA